MHNMFQFLPPCYSRPSWQYQQHLCFISFSYSATPNTSLFTKESGQKSFSNTCLTLMILLNRKTFFVNCIFASGANTPNFHCWSQTRSSSSWPTYSCAIFSSSIFILQWTSCPPLLVGSGSNHYLYLISLLVLFDWDSNDVEDTNQSKGIFSCIDEEADEEANFSVKVIN